MTIPEFKQKYARLEYLRQKLTSMQVPSGCVPDGWFELYYLMMEIMTALNKEDEPVPKLSDK